MITIYCLTGVFGEIRLNQSPSEMKRPGETVKMSCAISEFDMSGYYIHWSRQKAGKALEWIGRMRAGSHTEYSQTFKSHFILSYDLSSSIEYLNMKNLTAEDSAVYFCARWEVGIDGTLKHPHNLINRSLYHF
uniref:Ig-like domain-containing protein n=1 Tax=Acanthochromis polyacanthus TaxID=80966 RepID=A0A3Q1FW04_9TELE